MKSLAYALIASTALVMICFAPVKLDRGVCAGIFGFCVAGIMSSDKKKTDGGKG